MNESATVVDILMYSSALLYIPLAITIVFLGHKVAVEKIDSRIFLVWGTVIGLLTFLIAFSSGLAMKLESVENLAGFKGSLDSVSLPTLLVHSLIIALLVYSFVALSVWYAGKRLQWIADPARQELSNTTLRSLKIVRGCLLGLIAILVGLCCLLLFGTF